MCWLYQTLISVQPTSFNKEMWLIQVNLWERSVMHPEHGLRQKRNIKRRKNISGRNQGIKCKINILFSTIKWRICKRQSALLCRTANPGVQFTNLFLNYWITQLQSKSMVCLSELYYEFPLVELAKYMQHTKSMADFSLSLHSWEAFP